MAEVDPITNINYSLADAQSFAHALEQAGQQLPPGVAMDTSMMLVRVAKGDKELLKKLRAAILRQDFGDLVKNLQDSDVPNKEIVDKLAQAHKTKDSLGVRDALRRLAGDDLAGTQQDEFKEVPMGVYVQRNNISGQIEPLFTPASNALLPEMMQNAYEMNHPLRPNGCWKHQSGGSFVVRPMIIPKPESTYNRAQVYGVTQQRPSASEWEKAMKISPVLLNIMNGLGDAGMTQVDPTYVMVSG
eukprot:gnl/TRDRNA2_/TRDRNA2_64509_c0_seq1.p1 gnl/TRDRNA2_/TRDRNA2_64509_c0~~gnl/TRDRNA2_/TRDRNA2_64509_c0_seq1.p1  ORF type:complete len:244 (-),score=54.51 gnl/TRDRNA2_/TRDRNA2_64509_c0_seq1:104-835(-)